MRSFGLMPVTRRWEIEPTIKLAKDLSLTAAFEYDSHPIKAGEFWQISGGLQLEKNF